MLSSHHHVGLTTPPSVNNNKSLFYSRAIPSRRCWGLVSDERVSERQKLHRSNKAIKCETGFDSAHLTLLSRALFASATSACLSLSGAVGYCIYTFYIFFIIESPRSRVEVEKEKRRKSEKASSQCRGEEKKNHKTFDMTNNKLYTTKCLLLAACMALL